MNVDASVLALVDAIVAAPDSNELDLVRQLQTHGIDELAAERLIAFVPTAMGRAVLQSDGASFGDDYEIRDLDSGRSWKGRLSQEPEFRAAQRLAETCGLSDPRVAVVADRSAEMNVARQLLKPGQPASVIAFTEPVFLRIPVPKTQSRRPWWRPW